MFRYRALDARGGTSGGMLEAATRIEALDQLHRRGLVPLNVDEDAALAGSRHWFDRVRVRVLARRVRMRLPARSLLSLTHSLAALLNSGLTVDRALTISASLENRPVAARFLDELARAVRAGATLAAALRGTGVSLPVYYLSMVEAGELGGSLPQTLARAAALLRRNIDVRERIQSALIYPIILACVVLGTLVALLVVVLPRFQALFAESAAQLPWSTRMVLEAGEFASQYWWPIACVLAACAIATRAYLSSAAGRQRIDRWLLQSRLTFGLPGTFETARMLRTLSTLLHNGVPLPAALRIAQGTLGNSCLCAALARVTQGINAGEGFAAALAAVRVFPGEAIQLARVGEETGRLHEMLAEAASILESGGERTLERLLALLVPSVTVFMGLMVAGLVGSVLLGLLSVNELAF